MSRHAGEVEWTEALVARLKELHAQERRFAAMAEILSTEFHVKLSTSALIGKAHRLGLPKRATGPLRQTEADPAPLRARLRWRVALPAAKPLPGARIQIWELRSGVCHFPHGDRPPYLYCGAAAPDKPPYCHYHHRVMYGGGRAP